MEARMLRTVRDGKAFDHLFPPPTLQDSTRKRFADVEDTMKLIRETVPMNAWQVEKIAKKLKGKDLRETCSNIWHFVYNHIKYKRDKDGVEQVRSPRRTWWERFTGVDCDCYTEFICSILHALKIPAKARITKYPKRPPEEPRWQHVYPIVPVSGRLNGDLSDRSSYITMDCVKDKFDDEQPFLERKDYAMKLDYLDGFDDEGTEEVSEDVLELMGLNDADPETVDLSDLASLYDEQEMGSIFKKIGKGIKKAAQKVGKVVQKVAHVVNKLNPVTLLLRNGFLLAMKLNMFNTAGKLRYSYLSDEQAKSLGMNIDALNRLRKVRANAEKIYYHAGGQASALKKAVLTGKGNKDKKVPMSGLDGLGEVYSDQEEYRIANASLNELGELGDPATGASIAAATSAVAAIAAALKQVKGLFNKGGKEEQEFQAEKDSSEMANTMSDTSSALDVSKILDMPVQEASPAPSPQIVSESTSNESYQYQDETDTSFSQDSAPSAKSLLSNSNAATRVATTELEKSSPGSSLPATQTPQTKEGFLQKATKWAKNNKGKLAIAGVAIVASIVAIKVLGNKKKSVDGLPARKKRKRNKKQHHHAKREKIQHQILL